MTTTIQGGVLNYNVTRSGSRISIEEPSDGRRSRAEGYTVDVGRDTVSLRGREKNFDITLRAPDELWVQVPPTGRRCSDDGYSIKFDRPLQNFERTALAVASSLCGVPIVFADESA